MKEATNQRASRPGSKKKKIIIISAAVVLIVLVVIFNLRAQREKSVGKRIFFSFIMTTLLDGCHRIRGTRSQFS